MNARTMIALLLAATCVFPATAQIIVNGTLSAPVSLLPAPSVITYQYGAPNVTFVWDQYPATRSVIELVPHHFLLCLRRNTDGPCTHASAIANVLPANLLRTPIYTASPYFPTGYRYSFTPTIPDDRLDVRVSWQVAGCLNANDSSCKFSSIALIAISSVELKAGNISTTLMGTQYFINAKGDNLGSRTTPPFSALIYNWEVLVDSVRGVCRTDPNAADIRAETTLYVIDKKGKATQFSRLQRDAAGNYVVSNVIGIYRPNSDYNYQSLSIPGLTLGAATTAQNLGTMVMSLPTPMNRGRPFAFVSAVQVDSFNEFYEADEGNNSRAECEVVN